MKVHHVAVCSNCRFHEIGFDKNDAEDLADQHREAEPDHQVTIKENPIGGAAEYPDRR
ncbi:hypothetical protein [Natrinema gari]|uniref:hypothetical protein n=1 Tax=Natrinema gari TaxID=419186 RepID=UPI000A7FDCEF|nr:hypothetical protein [Natrinema gari]